MKVWRILFISFVIDGAVAIGLNSVLTAEQAQVAAVVGAIIALPFIHQKGLLQGLARVRRSQNRSRQTGSRQGAIVMAVLLVVLVAAKLVFLPTLNNIASLAFAAILLLGIISSARHVMRESRSHAEALRTSPWLYITMWERQLVVLFSLPMVAARSISLIGALSLGSTPHPYFAVLYLATSVVLLLILQPQRASFIGWCPRCKSPTPIAFVEYGSCPKCDATLAQSGVF
jgi:hypothetical protein